VSRDDDTPTRPITRRDVLRGAGLAAGAALGGSALVGPRPVAAGDTPWDDETDVVVVGSGAAAGSAAVFARHAGLRVLMLEKLPLTGGTTAKSGGVTWIANNFTLREKGIDDNKADCLKYFARYAYPRHYNPESPNLGLPEGEYKLLEAFYDNGWRMIDALEDIGAVRFKEFRMFFVDRPAPDYADHLPENKVPAGRALEPASGGGSTSGGDSLAAQLASWFEKHGGEIRTDHAVTAVIVDDGRVVGVEAQTGGRAIRIKANRGVVFGTGGFAHNLDLVQRYQPSLYGSCAAPGATGDIIPITAAAGAKIGRLDGAWRTQVVLEEVLANRISSMCAFVLPGDSMVVVNKYGRRIVNEKRDYNDRTESHFEFDVTNAEYPNHLQFFVFDGRSLDAFGGAYPIPRDKRESPYLVEAETLAELGAKIDARLATLEAKTGSVRLDPGFTRNLTDTIAKFNGYARAGEDPEFHRGAYAYDREWHLLFSARREGASAPENPFPNITMHPFTEKGPYYAFILGAGALDTNAGPVINEHAQILALDGTPIEGLYGAGNCVASPTGRAYYGPGGTIGPALTFGYIAARHLSGRSV